MPSNVEYARAEFPASVSADSVLTVSRAMKLGPGYSFQERTPSTLHFA